MITQNNMSFLVNDKYVTKKAILATGREMSRSPQFLDNQFSVGGKVVSLTRRPLFTPRKIPGTHFC
jgi:hypothetical protein